MSVVFNAATAANVAILQQTNSLFQLAQKRVATGKMIFGAADDATRYTMSQTMLSRSKNIDAVNNNISTALKTLESTDTALKQVRNLLQQMNNMASQALNAGSVSTVTANPTANIGDTTAVSGASAGHRLSITSDNGKNFTYTFSGATGTTTWGQVANALNAANIGVTLKFDTSNAAAPRLILESSDGKTGFTIDGSSSQQVVGNLTGLSSGYDGAYAASQFVNGTSTPSGFSATTPYGLKFGTGGAVTTASTMPAATAVNSSITFVGGDGVARTWSSTTAKAPDVVAAEINAMNAGVTAEITNGGRLRLRNTSGNAMTILNGSGTFDSNAGAARFNATAGVPVVTGNPVLGTTNNEDRLRLGTQFEAYKTEITSLISNNVVQSGQNLLNGQNMSVILNEFASNPISISGVTMTVTGYLGLAQVGTSWTTNGNISTSLSQVQGAMAAVDKVSGQFGTYSSFIKDRYDLNKEFSSNLKSLGDDLVAADVAEESAKLTALQTQQQFAVQAFSAGTQNANSLLRLLG